MKNKTKKSQLKLILCMLLIIGSISLIRISPTYSYFSEEKQSTLVYKANLYDLYNEYSMTLDGKNSNINQAKFRFSFNENKAVLDHEIDKYEIVIPNTCTFDQVKIDGQLSNIDPGSHSHTITFNNRANRITWVYITCPINSNNSTIQFTTKVNETITTNVGKENEKQAKFTYAKYSYLENYQNYVNRFQATEKTNQIKFSTAGMMRAEFSNKLKTYTMLSSEAIKGVYNTPGVTTSIMRNFIIEDDVNGNPVIPATAFTDYYSYKDNNRYVLIKIASDGIKYNTFDIDLIDISDDIDMTFDNVSDSQLTIHISGSNESSVMHVVEDLNSSFGKDITTNKQEQSEGGQYIVEYNITK